jgi:hypothetical protein
LSTLRENSSTVLQSPTLLNDHNISGRFYKSFQNSRNSTKISGKKSSSRKLNIKNKIADFILHKFLSRISSYDPYYFPPLPARVWKLIPTSLSSESISPPVFLKSSKETENLLSQYVVKCYNLLKPKTTKPPKVHKSQPKLHNKREE